MTKENMLAWQSYPEKFIRYASRYENTKDDFERLVGYLLLDAGVETILKAFVLADTSLKYSERESSAKGMIGKDSIPDSKITAVNFEKITFHNLLETVKLAAKSKVTDEELKNADHYHGVRNIIYHEGRKTIPSEQDFHEYLALAKSFLHNLLGVEWENQEQENNQVSKKVIFTHPPRRGRLFLEDATGPEPYKKEYYKQLKHKVEIATAIFRPAYITESFERGLREILSLYDEENQRMSLEEIKKEFNKLARQEIEDTNFIYKCVDDVTFLRLNALGKKLNLEDKDIEMYLEFKKWAFDPIKPIEEFTPEDVQRVEKLDMWAYELEIKIDNIIESHISQK